MLGDLAETRLLSRVYAISNIGTMIMAPHIQGAVMGHEDLSQDARLSRWAMAVPLSSPPQPEGFGTTHFC